MLSEIVGGYDSNGYLCVEMCEEMAERIAYIRCILDK